jgi:hypothetical protein
VNPLILWRFVAGFVEVQAELGCSIVCAGAEHRGSLHKVH